MPLIFKLIASAHNIPCSSKMSKVHAALFLLGVHATIEVLARPLANKRRYEVKPLKGIERRFTEDVCNLAGFGQALVRLRK